MHSALSRRIATDEQGRYLLTCSDDKTARLWDAASGKQLNVFRIPIGDTREGRLYACALSKDGKTAAVGGQTGFEWSASFSIYIINTQTGDIISRIESLPAIINDLEFSPDGNYLAAGLGKTAGVHIFNTNNWSPYITLENYGAAVFNIAFNKSGMMAVAAFDGKLHLYDKKFQLVKEIRTVTSEKLFSVAFHPQQNLIAVGYHDNPKIDVINIETGETSYQPSIAGAEKEQGALEILSFSPDGKKLSGMGRFTIMGKDSIWKWVVRTWDEAGKGGFNDVPLLKNAASDGKYLPNGSLAVLGTNPDLALLNPQGKLQWYLPAGICDYGAANRSDFSISRDGSVIVFNPAASKLYQFDIKRRSVKEDVDVLKTYADSTATTIVRSWQGGLAPTINGNKISFLSENERSFSTDVSSDGNTVVIGTGSSLYLSNGRGEKLWKTAIPGIALSVVITENQKAVVACLADGTIRWYNLVDGKELLAFFLHADHQRWVLFTPTGYYDAAPGAEDLLGWHLNNGPAAKPSYYPVSRYRDQFYRPDIVDIVFETYNEAQAISLANQRSGKKEITTAIASKPVPSIQISSPANGSIVQSTTVNLQYLVKNAENIPGSRIKILVNGRPVSNSRGFKVADSNVQGVDVIIPPADCVITLLAENENGTSPEANLYLKWKSPEKENPATSSRPTLYVLSIGISKYNKEQYRLQYAAKDASDFSSTLLQQKGVYYKDVVVKKLTDAEATKVNILDALQWIQEKTKANDMAMIFFAGHGMNDNNGIYYMLPVDADAERLRSSCINFEEVKQTQSTIEGKVIVFIDACHSGNITGGSGNYINGLINLLTSTVKGAGAITFTSSTGREFSLEDPSWGNGAFTKAVIEGLKGAAAVDQEKEITYTSLSLYISRRVKKLTSDQQHPTLVPTPNTPDFTIAVQK